ncbi:hypothetical protein [Amaricoccus sp.]|uniref:hypothetical protein n=1 Tax=Amaricoccus sp. TaxID=1872485 RepID=UPI00260A1226|nr:hypothetical protein [uncultured Amaricoccus sp.]
MPWFDTMLNAMSPAMRPTRSVAQGRSQSPPRALEPRLSQDAGGADQKDPVPEFAIARDLRLFRSNAPTIDNFAEARARP